MSYGDERSPSRHRARQEDAAPEPYPWHSYGDGLPANSVYAEPVADAEPGQSYEPGWGYGADSGCEADPGYPQWRYEPEPPYEWERASEPEPPTAAPEEPLREPIGSPLEEPRAKPADEPLAQRSDTPPGGRAGRNLPAAIGVGLALGGAVLLSLLIWRPAFLGVLIVAAVIGTWELVRALRPRAYPPMVPLMAGAVLMLSLAWFGGAPTLPLGLLATIIAVAVWRFADGVPGYDRDVTAAALVAVYVGFLASFAALLARPADGHVRVLVTLVGVVLCDTGGYAFGVLFGRHPMARSVSPKKSWEGFAGSMLCAGLGSAVLLHLALHTRYWEGALFGLAVAVAAVVGDLAESMLKRDLRIKDMSNLLPGHGGLMDRLDSILLAVPTAYAILAVIVPMGM